nr:hypothetical protein [uncultured Sulfurimonas sp.]
MLSSYSNKKDYTNFKLQLHDKTLKSKHDDYTYNTRTIRVFNSINTPREHLVGTSIHELAHHVEVIDTGSSGHSKNFCKIMKELLEVAIEKDYIDYKLLKEQNSLDANDIKMLEKYFPSIEAVV